MTEALWRRRGTILEIGSEFRPVKDLKKLFNGHVYWDKMKDIIKEGVKRTKSRIFTQFKRVKLRSLCITLQAIRVVQ